MTETGSARAAEGPTLRKLQEGEGCPAPPTSREGDQHGLGWGCLSLRVSQGCGPSHPEHDGFPAGGAIWRGLWSSAPPAGQQVGPARPRCRGRAAVARTEPLAGGRRELPIFCARLSTGMLSWPFSYSPGASPGHKESLTCAFGRRHACAFEARASPESTRSVPRALACRGGFRSQHTPGNGHLPESRLTSRKSARPQHPAIPRSQLRPEQRQRRVSTCLALLSDFSVDPELRRGGVLLWRGPIDPQHKPWRKVDRPGQSSPAPRTSFFMLLWLKILTQSLFLGQCIYSGSRVAQGPGPPPPSCLHNRLLIFIHHEIILFPHLCGAPCTGLEASTLMLSWNRG